MSYTTVLKIRCDCCNNTFDADELLHIEESRGEFWGMPAYETMTYCPCCYNNYGDSGDLYEEHVLIDEYGEEVNEDEIYD